MAPDSWTLESANAAVPRVAALLKQARAIASTIREAQAQLNDIRLIHGDQVLSPAGAGHQEFSLHLRQWQDARDELDHVIEAFTRLGAELKDIDTGLVDFRGKVGDRDAYLCWKEGETTITHWHELESGFTGRKPLPSLQSGS